MKLATIFLALFLLSGCGTEGVDMEISDVDDWFKVNETEITSIVTVKTKIINKTPILNFALNAIKG